MNKIKILLAAAVFAACLSACGNNNTQMPSPSPTAENDLNSSGSASKDMKDAADDMGRGVKKAVDDVGNGMKNMAK